MSSIAEHRRALSPMDRDARLARVRSAAEAAGCASLVVTKRVNIRWLTGFTGSNGLVILTPDALTLVTDGRYRTQVHQQLADAGVDASVVITREIGEPLVAAVGGDGPVGLESDDVTWALQRRIAGWLPGRDLVATSDLIEAERRVKDRGELDRLRLAAAIADEALAGVRPQLGRGRTEIEIARALDNAMAELGADGVSFPTIVAAGPNSAKPHATPGDRPIGSGDLLVIDFGASVDGYGSDMTRSFLVGATTARQQEVYDAVAEAQAAGVAAVADGVDEREVDRVCRDTLSGHGLGDAFLHGTGHGIGLEIHERPLLSQQATGILRSGSVVTVEPGAYLPDLGGVRIEDSVVVTASGCEAITHSPKEPRIET